MTLASEMAALSVGRPTENPTAVRADPAVGVARALPGIDMNDMRYFDGWKGERGWKMHKAFAFSDSFPFYPLFACARACMKLELFHSPSKVYFRSSFFSLRFLVSRISPNSLDPSGACFCVISN